MDIVKSFLNGSCSKYLDFLSFYVGSLSKDHGGLVFELLGAIEDLISNAE